MVVYHYPRDPPARGVDGHVFPVRAAVPVNLAIKATMHMEVRRMVMAVDS